MNWHAESTEARDQRRAEWHKWFAWYPVRVGERRYWLEHVERKVINRLWNGVLNYETFYKAPQNDTK